jgi:hypothetical protein
MPGTELASNRLSSSHVLFSFPFSFYCFFFIARARTRTSFGEIRQGEILQETTGMTG